MGKTVEVNERYLDTVFNQLDFRREILDSDKRLFMLIAGVGAGKNFWVKTLTEKGHEDKGYSPNGYKVLLITSRVATVDAQVIKLDADKRFDFFKLFAAEDWWGDDPPVQKVVCCTNSYIEWYVKNQYDPDNPQTHVWNAFDFIVLDEAHSMTCDATFSEAPFHVQSFLRHAHREAKNCRIVLMSGTPEPVSWLYEGVANEAAVQAIDLYKKCRHIEPKHVRLLPSVGLADEIAKKLNKGKRIIYFATRTDSMRDLISALNEKGIPNDDIGISYSKDPKKDEKFPAELVEKMKRIKDALSEQEEVPSDVKILISTSKNKEGININNADIKDMVVESHQRDEVRQMAGRVRNGLDYLVIDKDAPQHWSNGSALLFAVDRKCLASVNEAVLGFWESEKRRGMTVRRRDDISAVEAQFRYLRFDFFEEKFRVYTGRHRGDKLAAGSEGNFQANVEDWAESIYTGDYYGYDQLKAWFPSADIINYEARTLRGAVGELFEEKDVLGRVITKAERDILAEEIRELVKFCKQEDTHLRSDFSSLKPALTQLGYDLDYAPGVRHGNWFVISRLEQGENC